MNITKLLTGNLVTDTSITHRFGTHPLRKRSLNDAKQSKTSESKSHILKTEENAGEYYDHSSKQILIDLEKECLMSKSLHNEENNGFSSMKEITDKLKSQMLFVTGKIYLNIT